MHHMSRRTLLAGGAAAAAGLPAVALAKAGTIIFPSHSRAIQDEKRVVKKGRVKQSVARWCFGKIKLDELAKACAEMGMAGIDLIGPNEWKIVQDHGLLVTTAMVGAGGIPDGLNDRKHHDKIVKAFEKHIPMAAEAKIPNVICFFGNRVAGMSEQEAVDNSVECLNRVKGLAEEQKVTVIVELLNSKVDHGGYIGDNTPYCKKVIKGADSPYVKLLYDIYHAQIMEGDVMRTIKKEHSWIGHYHTGGNPGRNEIDDSQELNYAAITKAVVDTGFTAYYAHEFIPKRPDPIKSLREAVALCDV